MKIGRPKRTNPIGKKIQKIMLDSHGKIRRETLAHLTRMSMKTIHRILNEKKISYALVLRLVDASIITESDKKIYQDWQDGVLSYEQALGKMGLS